MLETTSKEFRHWFLLEFTKGIINSYNKNRGTYTPQLTIKPIRKTMEIKERLSSFAPKVSPIPRQLNIPEEQLPLRLQYIRPIPQEKDLDLGRLNELLKNPYLQVIECDGAGERITIKAPDAKPTDIILSSEEINQILQTFSEAKKIPIEEGVIKIVAGRLILLALISEITGNKFIIRKLAIPRQQY